jgi:type III pantothenate kinase
MILVFDVGNTETTVGLFDGESLRGQWRVTTDLSRTPDEISLLIRALLASDEIDRSAVDRAAIGSVVPSLTGSLAEACERAVGARPLIIDAGSPLPIRLDVEEPLTVGADRIINTLAASRLYKRDTIVVDLGTATTYDCITADGVFLGGVIAPGVRTSAETLFRRTSKLPATEIVPPVRVIGRRTEECIRSGVVLGSAEAIDGLVRRIKAEWPGKAVPLVVATGGLATTFQPFCKEFDLVEPHLTLTGLRIAHELVSAGS